MRHLVLRKTMLAPSPIHHHASHVLTCKRPSPPALRANRSNSRLHAAAVQDKDTDVVIVGAGVAGLNCAVELQKAGVSFVLLEASDGVGGRVRTDELDGFLLDRGFQIFLTSYPEAKAALDYEALSLKPFYAGALVRFQGDFHRVADPLRHLVDGLSSLPNPIGSPQDKVRVGVYRLKSLLGSLEDVLSEKETTILEALRAEGFSEAIIDRFFRPFLGGIFFDRNLGTTSRLFKFVMRMLATGQNCLPAAGIGAVPDQLASRLPPSALRLRSRVAEVAPAGAGGVGPSITLEGGEALRAKAVVVAVEGPEASRLLGAPLQAAPSKAAPGVGTACLYFAAPRPPRAGNVLYLDGEGGRLVNNMCFPSEVSSSYAPAGQTLVSVSTIGTRGELSDQQLEEGVRREVGEWFGAGEVASWRHLRTYRIPFAQPSQAPPTDLNRPLALGGGLYVCGDHRLAATLDGALKSGRLAAAEVVKGLEQQGVPAQQATVQ